MAGLQQISTKPLHADLNKSFHNGPRNEGGRTFDQGQGRRQSTLNRSQLDDLNDEQQNYLKGLTLIPLRPDIE